MPRKSSVWWNTGKNAYYVKIHGKQVRLSDKKDEAEALFDQMRKKQLAPEMQDINTCRTIFNLYLDYIETQRPESYRVSRSYLQSFLDQHKEIMVRDLRAVHIHQWLNAHSNWGDSSGNGAVGWVLSALNWAAKPENRYISRNPIAGLRRPAVRSRGEEAIIDPNDHEKLLNAANPALRDALFALQQTGTRPGNICRITAADCDFVNNVITLSRHKTARKTGTKLKIPMTFPLRERLLELCKKWPQGPILRTVRGKPWASNYLSEIVGRVRKRIGLKARVTPYGHRHTVATSLLMNGIPDAIVAQLLGHTSTAMLYKHYGHLGIFIKPLGEALDRVINKGNNLAEMPKIAIFNSDGSSSQLAGEPAQKPAEAPAGKKPGEDGLCAG